MNVDLGAEGFGHLLDSARQALRAAGEPVPDVRGEGESAGGLVGATAGGVGTLESLRIDPRALRAGSQELAEQIVEAVNAALLDLRTRAGVEPSVPAQGPAELAGELEKLQEEALDRFGAFTDTIGDVLARIEGRSR
ncbi:YbaB/EbfC family nucleoid-associated protein [Streptosporangium sp. NPDC051023]|uniref:YbaB/EbfC family nucleoid-associated protein n=1 Tax=Streptosporangium sp. NPDC051023 TaxID=3155410 RepID=UPI00345021BC